MRSTLGETRVYDGFEEDHRADKSKTGLLFLYIYLRDQPKRQHDAETVLKQYFGMSSVSPSNFDEDNVKPLEIEELNNEEDQCNGDIEAISSTSSDLNDSAFVTDQSDDLSESSSDAKSAINRQVDNLETQKKDKSDVNENDDVLVPVKLKLSQIVNNVQLYADVNQWKPIEMTLQTEDKSWSVHVNPKLGEYKFLVHERNGRSFWATDDQSMVVRKPPAGVLNNICRYEGGPVFAITRDDHGTTHLTIKANADCAFASNYHKFRDATSVAVHTDVNWSERHEMTLVNGDWIVTLPPKSLQCKFVLDGYRWTTLDQMPFIGNQGWNCNNVLDAVYRKV